MSGTGYVRQSSAQIAAGQPVAPTPVNNEFNQLQSAFSGSTGHSHDGSTGNSPPLNPSAINGIGSSTSGFVSANGSNVFNARTITGTSAQILITNGAGIAGNPTIAIDTGYAGQTSITTLGTISTGSWQGTLVSPTYGGSGINNGAFTTTLGGNFVSNGPVTFAGNFGTTLTVTAATSITLPTTGVVCTTVGSSSIVTVGNIATGTWSATKIALNYGGTNSDLSLTGGTSQVLKQTSAGAAVTVGQLAASDLSNGVSGSGAVVLVTGASLVTPTLGVATATTINKITLTTPASGSTLTILDGKTFAVNKTLTLTGTDSTTITFQGTDTYVGRATTDTFTNKTLDTAGTGNSFLINGTAVSTVTGTGSVVLATSPTLITASLGSSTATTQSAADSSTKLATTAFVNGTALTLTSGTTATTQASNDSTTKVATTAFVNRASTQSANGSMTLPNGLIFQWGTTGNISSGTFSSISFPTVFPNACFSVTATSNVVDSVATSSNCVNTLTTTSFSCINKQSNTTTFTWMAIGN